MKSTAIICHIPRQVSKNAQIAHALVWFSLETVNQAVLVSPCWSWCRQWNDMIC